VKTSNLPTLAVTIKSFFMTRLRFATAVTSEFPFDCKI
jgi:hypothetical protein